MGNMSNMVGMNQANFATLPQSYINAVTKPNVNTYLAEIPNANWARTFAGVIALALINVVISLIFAGVVSSSMNQLRDQLSRSGRTLPFDPTALTATTGIGAIITTPLFFILGAGVLYGLAKMFGGQGRDFMTHSYLLSLSYVPLGIAAAILNIIPGVGSFLGLAILIYRQYSQGLSMQASQNMQPGRAQLAAFLPFALSLVLVCLCVIAAIFLVAGAAVNGSK